MKDNRPPEWERTLKRGDTGKDGRVFWGYCAAAKGGEYWITQDKFNKMSGNSKEKSAIYYQNKKDKIRAKAIGRYVPVRKEYEVGSDEWLRHKAAVRRRWVKKKRLTDVNFKIRDNLRRRLNIAVRDNSKAGRTMNLVGCNIDDLKKHLESKFTYGMTWENYGLHGWHIDHIRPCASFDLSLDSEQIECFHYSNLQPLWAEDNLRKSDKYYG